MKRVNYSLSNDIPITVERTRRKKTASIQINNGRVRVLVPRHMREREIRDLIARKTDWIEKTTRIHAGLTPAVRRAYVDDECFRYLGQEYRLKLIRGVDEPVTLKRGYLSVGLGPGDPDRESIRERLVDWYKTHALDWLQRRTAELAEVIGARPASVAVKSYKSRWGSCTSDGRITYNWKIIVAPPEIVDYVVVHELCHLLELNHSPAYWDLVRRVFPEYRDAKKWLRENGHLLEV